jgi:hypothetical protein
MPKDLLKQNIVPHHTATDNLGTYSIYMLIKYCTENNVRIETISVENLLNNLELPMWKNKENGKFISPMEVINNKNLYREEYKNIMDADLKYPIILDVHYDFVDGAHRLSKAYINGIKTIDSYIITLEELKHFRLPKTRLKKIKNLTHKTLDNLYGIISRKINKSRN